MTFPYIHNPFIGTSGTHLGICSFFFFPLDWKVKINQYNSHTKHARWSTCTLMSHDIVLSSNSKSNANGEQRYLIYANVPLKHSDDDVCCCCDYAWVWFEWLTGPESDDDSLFLNGSLAGFISETNCPVISQLLWASTGGLLDLFYIILFLYVEASYNF